MEEYIEKTQADFNDELERVNAEHAETKVKLRTEITKIKFDLDKVLELKIQ